MHRDGHKTIKLFLLSDLPVTAQGLPRRKLRITDLSSGQQAQAANYDNAVIINGSEMTIIAPTGSVAEAISAANEQRAIDGI
tara:strand:- start:1558 stop:1803 length:246 start_codon:yes stop_codon:yes gene_type:complete